MSEASIRSRRAWALLAGIVALGFLLRLACAILLPSPLVSDYLVYWELAINFQSGLGLVDEAGKLTAFMSLGYPIFLGAIFYFFGPEIAVVKAANIALACASMIFLFFAVHRLFKSIRMAAISTFIFAVYLEGIVYSSYVAKENLMIFLMIIQLWVACDRNLLSNRFVNPILFGSVSGLSAIVGNAALSLMPSMILLIFLNNGGAFRLLRYFFIAFLVGLLTMVPLLMRNKSIFDAYLLNNNGGFNLYIGNNPNATPFFISITSTPIGPQWQELHGRLGERQIDLLLRRMALDYMWENPKPTIILMAQKAFAFWLPPIHSGQGPESLFDYCIRVLWLVQFSSICLLFIISAAFLRNHIKYLGPIWLMVAGYTAIHMIFYVVYRYRLPIMPFVSIGAAFSISTIISGLTSWSVARNAISKDSPAVLPSGFGPGENITPKLVK